jgi:hypothetical protein
LLRALVITIVLLSSLAASADDRWSRPHAGIAVLERRMRGPNVVHAVVADLCTPGVRVRATRSSERGQTVGDFSEASGAIVAINGDFYDHGYAPVGLAMGDGERWADTRDSMHWGFVGFGEGRVEVALPEDPHEPPEPWMREAIGGIPELVVDGDPVVSYVSPFCRRRHPRSAIGVSEDRRTLILAVVEGRTARSAGMTCREMAALMAELGAAYAINVDGGGSSALFVRERGVINRLSDGGERTVANHLALVSGGGVDACPWQGPFPPGGEPYCDAEIPADGAPLTIGVTSRCFAPSGPALYGEGDRRATTAIACAHPGPHACAASDTSARWYFHSLERAHYRVEVRVPESAEPLTERAPYTLRTIGSLHEVIVDQSRAGGGWITVFPDVELARENNVALELHDNTGELDRRTILFSDVRITRRFAPSPEPYVPAPVGGLAVLLLALTRRQG